jgi:hypothetical protein
MSSYSHISTAAMGKLEVPQMVEAGTPSVDGIPMSHSLHEFCTELRKKFPKVKFHANADYNKINRTTLMVSDVLVYTDDCDYVLGRIGYGKDYAMSGADEPVFMVESRKIQNEKYAEYRDQYFRVFTKDISKALKNAQRYLLPYSSAELLTTTYGTFKTALETRRYTANRAFDQAIGRVSPSVILGAEIDALFSKGVEFTTSEFQLHVQEIVDKYRRRQQVFSKDNRTYFITLRVLGDNQVAEIATCKDPKGSNPKLHDFYEEPNKTVRVDSLPEDITAKIATLMLVDVGEHIEGVGLRASTRSFWIERGV